MEQGLAEGEAAAPPMGETPATRLRGGPGEEEGEGLDTELRHLETEDEEEIGEGGNGGVGHLISSSSSQIIYQSHLNYITHTSPGSLEFI